MRNAPALHRAMDRRGAGANLMPFIIQSIEKLNTWQVGLQLAPFWAWEAHHVR